MRGYLIPPREGCVVVVGVAKVSLVEVQLVVHEGLEVLKVSLGEILLEEPKIRVISKVLSVKLSNGKTVKNDRRNDHN